MPSQTVAAEINTFVKGIITEASPLTFPENASINEVNMVLNKDGSRRRRLGLDLEEGFQVVSTGITSLDDIGITSFDWKSPGGFSDKEFLVVQIGNQLKIFDSSLLPISANLIATFPIGTDTSIKMSMTSVDGVLVVASGQVDIYTFDYNGSTITQSTGRLKIRDLFGVEDIIGGVNLREGSGLAIRPAATTNAHTYNLRNQTWAIPRYPGNVEALWDPIAVYLTDYGKVQSNSDSLIPYYYAFANDADDRETNRFNVRDMDKNPLGTNLAPIGYFIIDALARGSSRVEQVNILMDTYPSLTLGVSTLPQDTTPGGATVVGGFAGRVWYGGFSSQVIDGDSNSPRMTSYILFSKLVDNISDIVKCYQDGDPTSTLSPDLVDTDGGFIRLDGAYNIQHMVNVGDALMVVAENGVWKVTGGSGYGFNSTNYLTSKITEHGSLSSNSVVTVDNTFMYWSDDGIYHVSQNQFGDWEASNLTTSTIQQYYDRIQFSEKVNCQGLYDAYQRQVRWLYNNTPSSTGPAKELVLDVGIGAFYPTSIAVTGSSQNYPRPLSIVRVPPYTTGFVFNPVVSIIADSVVTLSGDTVGTESTGRVNSTSEIYYLTFAQFSGDIKISFSFYRNTSFLDWKSFNGIGVDAAAYMLTGWSGFGDYQRNKQVPYITIYSIKTETGFDAELNPINSSSIKVQSQWSWTNSEESGKWGTEFQAYRHKRLWIPQDSSSGFDDGEYVVVTKNKLRGRGKVLSLYLHTEPGKDFYLLGWSIIATVNGMV